MSSTTPRLDPRWPPVLETLKITSDLTSSASCCKSCYQRRLKQSKWKMEMEDPVVLQAESLRNFLWNSLESYPNTQILHVNRIIDGIEKRHSRFLREILPLLRDWSFAHLQVNVRDWVKSWNFNEGKGKRKSTLSHSLSLLKLRDLVQKEDQI